VKVDPFGVSLEEKASKLLGINAAALKADADYCRSCSGLCVKRRCS
jgi:hypothetical protein